jgi:hypothetical protein
MTCWTLRVLLSAALLSSISVMAGAQEQAPPQSQQAFGRQWGNSYSNQDWNRMYHYPYDYYPQNFWGSDYYRSSQDMYKRYPPEMQIPVYNKQWFNEYPTHRKDPDISEHQFFPMFRKHSERHIGGNRYYSGSHFEADVF